MEHHSNIVPWQILRDELGLEVKVVPIDDAGEFQLDAYAGLLGPRTRLVAVTHVSNALGTITPVAEIVRLAHARGIPVLFDGAQAVPHLSVDVAALDCDFYAFSGHKLYGPTGIGVLYGKGEHLEAMPPYQGGGEMILSVSLDKTEYAPIPHKFEAGTPNIAGAVGFGAAIDYLRGFDMAAVRGHGTSPARLRHRAPVRDQQRPHLRYRQTQKRRGFVHRRRRAPPRCRHDSRP